MENKITSGIWFVFIGLILLLHNLDIIDFNFLATIKYWPLLIVIVGISLMAQNKQYGGYIKIGCNVLFLGWLFYIGMTSTPTHWTSEIWSRTGVKVGDLDEKLGADKVELPYDREIKEADLVFNGGAGKFELNMQKSEHLVLAENKDHDMAMNIDVNKKDGRQEITINAQAGSEHKKSGTSLIGLHADVRWNLELNCGTSSISGDLSSLHFNKLEINTGASKMDLKLGYPQQGLSNIAIATGASKIYLRFPKDAAIQVEYTSILSKNAFEGFETNEDGVAKTANYDQASEKYHIELEGAANTFTISRY